MHLSKYAVIGISVFILGVVGVSGIMPSAVIAQGQGGTTAPKPAQGGKTTNSPAQGGKTADTPSQGGTSAAGQTLVNPLEFDSLDGLIEALLKAVITLGTYILVFMLMWTGFKFVAARGNEEKIRDARRALMWTIIGGLILLGATAIKEVIQATVTSVTPQ